MFFFEIGKVIQKNMGKSTETKLYSNSMKWEISAYCQASNIRHTLAGNKSVDHSDVVGALPVGAAPTTSSFST